MFSRGLDLTLSIHEQLMPALDVTPIPHPYLVDKVHRGELGMRTGTGFRKWTDEQAQEVRDRLDRHLLGERPDAEPTSERSLSAGQLGMMSAFIA